jgi:pilus assembly protein CpaF
MSKQLVERVQKSLDAFTDNELHLGSGSQANHLEKMRKLVKEEISSEDPKIQKRILDEFFQLGPLEDLIADESICEILVNGPESIWIEKNGELKPHSEIFLSLITYRNILDRICHLANVHPTAEFPVCDGHFGPFRLNFVRSEVHPQADILSLRRHPENPWTLEKLANNGWCSKNELELIQTWVKQGKNFLVIGPTSSGKTSVLSACLGETAADERTLALEDSAEISLPNKVSLKLLTRKDSQGVLPDITLTDLLRTALRLRPDRIVVGEMRGPEAKDFLMALSSGHRGSMSSLHAEDAAQALMRLEMLVQLGAPQWDIGAIRRLIHLSLDGILVTGRDNQGQRKFKGIYSISSLEDSGFTLERSGTETLSARSSDKLMPLFSSL